MKLGIIPHSNSAPDTPSLVWNLRVEGSNIAFNLILGTLSPAQLSGLAGILSKVQEKPGNAAGEAGEGSPAGMEGADGVGAESDLTMG